MSYTAHLDTFARDNLPPRSLWPEFRFDLRAIAFLASPRNGLTSGALVPVFGRS